VFDSLGVFTRRFALPAISSLQGIESLKNGNLLITGFAADPEENNVLFEVSPNSDVIRGLLPIRRVQPTGTEGRASWDNFLSFGLSVLDNIAYVTASISDSLWTVDLATGAVESRQLVLPDIELTRDLPAQGFSAPIQLMSWRKDFYWAHAPVAMPGLIAVPFVKDDYAQGNIITAYSGNGSEWWYARGLPLFMRAAFGRILGLRGAGDSIQFDLHEYRPER
jgi:hypothetical protein